MGEELGFSTKSGQLFKSLFVKKRSKKECAGNITPASIALNKSLYPGAPPDHISMVGSARTMRNSKRMRKARGNK